MLIVEFAEFRFGALIGPVGDSEQSSPACFKLVSCSLGTRQECVVGTGLSRIIKECLNIEALKGLREFEPPKERCTHYSLLVIKFGPFVD